MDLQIILLTLLLLAIFFIQKIVLIKNKIEKKIPNAVILF